MLPITQHKTLFKFLMHVVATKCCILERTLTLRKPKGELAPLTRLKITESLSEGDRIGVEILSDPTSII